MWSVNANLPYELKGTRISNPVSTWSIVPLINYVKQKLRKTFRSHILT